MLVSPWGVSDKVLQAARNLVRQCNLLLPPLDCCNLALYAAYSVSPVSKPRVVPNGCVKSFAQSVDNN
jgi:hypothetical protein